jgi:hypothetical protein
VSDKVIVCKSCNKEFTLSDAQQVWFKDQGFSEPKRCKPCRDKRKAEKETKSGSGSSAAVGAPPKEKLFNKGE